jgi:hypothetical protein
LSSTHPVRLARRYAIDAVGALGRQHCRRGCFSKRQVHWAANSMPPNMPLNRTRNSMPPRPRGALVHHAPHGRGVTPLRAG